MVSAPVLCSADPMVSAPILCSADPMIKPWPEDQLS